MLGALAHQDGSAKTYFIGPLFTNRWRIEGLCMCGMHNPSGRVCGQPHRGHEH